VALQVPARFGDTEVVDEALVAAAHTDGLAVHVWTINDEPEMQRLLDLGVDGIITDRPTPLVALLVGQGLAYRPLG
jgi:glycerophosphoryl diester phosphodiesterase